MRLRVATQSTLVRHKIPAERPRQDMLSFHGMVPRVPTTHAPAWPTADTDELLPSSALPINSSRHFGQEGVPYFALQHRSEVASRWEAPSADGPDGSAELWRWHGQPDTPLRPTEAHRNRTTKTM